MVQLFHRTPVTVGIVFRKLLFACQLESSIHIRLSRFIAQTYRYRLCFPRGNDYCCFPRLCLFLWKDWVLTIQAGLTAKTVVWSLVRFSEQERRILTAKAERIGQRYLYW